ncbi:hypothetical protein LZ30DRAFT_731437 [Colletotrichum cereale]|nr:hypothetical protein LZ30DRAFT_731437 [Colletotrichum cereale]
MSDDNVSIYDEIEIEDMTYDEDMQIYHYPCPCGDKFQIALADLRDDEDIAVCPSCSLMIRVIFDKVTSPNLALWRTKGACGMADRKKRARRTISPRTPKTTLSPPTRPLPRFPSPLEQASQAVDKSIAKQDSTGSRANKPGCRSRPISRDCHHTPPRPPAAVDEAV